MKEGLLPRKKTREEVVAEINALADTPWSELSPAEKRRVRKGFGMLLAFTCTCGDIAEKSIHALNQLHSKATTIEMRIRANEDLCVFDKRGDALCGGRKPAQSGLPLAIEGDIKGAKK